MAGAAAGKASRARLRFTKLFGLWVYARDDRPWSGADPPAAVFVYSPVCRAERPATYLANFKGVVRVDGYSGFERLSDGGAIKLAACWSHTRRKFYEVHQATSSPIARGLATIAELYAIETAMRAGRPPHGRACANPNRCGWSLR